MTDKQYEELNNRVATLEDTVLEIVIVMQEFTDKIYTIMHHNTEPVSGTADTVLKTPYDPITTGGEIRNE